GARVVLDCYQSAGTVPLDVAGLGVDFAVGGSGEVALRRAGQRLAVRAARPDRAAGADARRLAGARRALRLRARAPLRRRRGALLTRARETREGRQCRPSLTCVATVVYCFLSNTDALVEPPREVVKL